MLHVLNCSITMTKLIYCIAGMFGGGEGLVNLMNHKQFAKLKLSKLVVTISNL